MTILAISAKGQEYLYKASTAHKVSKAKASVIAEALNKVKYQIKDNEVWYVHEVDQYDSAYVFAEGQRFTTYKNKLREVRG